MLENAPKPTSRLPQLGLSSFGGTLNEWESFRYHFTSLIVGDRSLSNLERLHYLLSCVKSEALGSISHLNLTDSNFDIAWQTLVAQYENKRELIYTHVYTLVHLPQIHSENASDLRTLRNHANAAIQALKNLGRPTDTWDDLLVFLVSERFDQASRRAWNLLKGDSTDPLSYAELDKFLESRIRDLQPHPSIKSDTSSKSSHSKSSHVKHLVPIRRQPIKRYVHCVKATIPCTTVQPSKITQ